MVSDISWNGNAPVITSWYGNGISFFDAQWDLLYARSRLPENSTDINNKQISGVDLAKDGKAWVATFNGLIEMDAASGKTLKYVHKGNSDLKTDRLNDVWCHPSGSEIWTANYDDGITIYNIKSQTSRTLNDKTV